MNRRRTDSIRCLLAGCCVFWCGCSTTPIIPPMTPPPVPPTSAAVGDQTIIAIAAPAPAGPSCTLPEFLGINQAIAGTAGLLRILRDRITSRLGGVFPGLEPTPPVLALADPANLGPDAAPSVQAAAKVKQQQDAGAQKAKAAAYLASVGCGCYEGVAEALAENLNDCSEEVRYATVKGLRDAATKGGCACGGNACCTPAVYHGLQKLAWETDATGCFIEPSLRVRRVARLALRLCCAPTLSPEDMEPPFPTEGPDLEEGELLGRNHIPASAAGLLALASSLSPVLAEVNGEPIQTEKVLQQAERQFLADYDRGGSSDISDSTLHRYMQEALEAAIDQTVLVQTAQAVLPQAVQTELRDRSPRQPAHGRDEPIRQVAYQSEDDEARLQSALAEELIRRQVDTPANVSAEDLMRWYDQHRQAYRSPDRYRWQRFAIPLADGVGVESATEALTFVRARETGFRVPVPEGFDERQIQSDDFDWTTLDAVPFPPVADQLKDLKPGEASEVVSSGVEVSFVMVREIEPGTPLPLASVRDRVEEDVLEDRRRRAERDYVAQLRQNATIRFMSAEEPADERAEEPSDEPAESTSQSDKPTR